MQGHTFSADGAFNSSLRFFAFMLPTRSNGIFTAKQQQKRIVTRRPAIADFSCRARVVRSLESLQRTEGCNLTHAHVIKQFRRDKTNMPPVHAKIHGNELDEQTTETVGKMSHRGDDFNIVLWSVFAPMLSPPNAKHY